MAFQKFRCQALARSSFLEFDIFQVKTHEQFETKFFSGHSDVVFFVDLCPSQALRVSILNSWHTVANRLMCSRVKSLSSTDIHAAEHSHHTVTQGRAIARHCPRKRISPHVGIQLLQLFVLIIMLSKIFLLGEKHRLITAEFLEANFSLS